MKNLFIPLIIAFSLFLNAQTGSNQKSDPLTAASPQSARIVALVARNGKIVFHKAYGKADSETGWKF
jgi:hypothetical protein